MKGVRVVLGVLSLAATWKAGYYLGARGTPDLPSSPSLPSLHDGRNPASVSDSRESAAAKPLSSANPAAPLTSYTSTSPSTPSDLISRYKLQERDAAMARVFPQSLTGQALRRIACFHDIVRPGEDWSAYYEELNVIKSQPALAFKDIRENIAKFQPEYARERQFVMQLVNQLELDPQEKTVFFAEELGRSGRTFSADDPNTFNGIIALRSYLNYVGSAAEIEVSLKPVLERANAELRGALLFEVERLNPNEAQRLKQELNPVSHGN